MAIIDIIFIGLLILFGLVGAVKGFLKTILSLASSLLSFTGAIYLAKPVVALLNNWFSVVTKLGSTLADKFLPVFTDFSSATGEVIKNEYFDKGGIIKQALSLFIDNSTVYADKTELVNELSSKAASLILIAICTILCWLLIRLAIFLLSKLFDALKKNDRAVNGMDKTLGLILGAVKGFAIIAIVFVIANLLQTSPDIASILDKVFNNSVIAKPVYDFVTTFANDYINKIDFSSLIASIK